MPKKILLVGSPTLVTILHPTENRYNTLVEDLEAIAKQMKPLVKTAFENGFSYDDGFAVNLLEAESDISDGIPDWIGIYDGIHLEAAITHCLLEWEWLLAQEQGQDGFKFAQNIREWEEKFVHHSYLNFYTREQPVSVWWSKFRLHWAELLTWDDTCLGVTINKPACEKTPLLGWRINVIESNSTLFTFHSRFHRDVRFAGSSPWFPPPSANPGGR